MTPPSYSAYVETRLQSRPGDWILCPRWSRSFSADLREADRIQSGVVSRRLSFSDTRRDSTKIAKRFPSNLKVSQYSPRVSLYIFMGKYPKCHSKISILPKCPWSKLKYPKYPSRTSITSSRPAGSNRCIRSC